MDGQEYVVAPARQLTDTEKKLIWNKPPSHKVSVEERRISSEIKRNWHRGEMKIATILLEGDAGSGKTQLAKALSANLGLPYTKVTCFADMDKSDVIGAILPVMSAERLNRMEPADQAVLQALYDSGGFHTLTEIAMDTLGVPAEQAAVAVKQLLKRAEQHTADEGVEYRFYPSEIVRAYREGYLLEIQEPTVIRDAAVLMALNSALELDGSMNLPTEIIRRHPDFVAVITTNRSYTGTRPLNEALRDRVQHTEKMDLPTQDVMVERAQAKTGFADTAVLNVLAEVITVLDQTARAHAIKGVAGMRSFFYWTDAVACGAAAHESLYHKVIYKITTDAEEIKLLEAALTKHGLLAALENIAMERQKTILGEAEIKSGSTADGTVPEFEEPAEEIGLALKKSADSEQSASRASDDAPAAESKDTGDDGMPIYHQGSPEPMSEEAKRQERDFRKKLNRDAREAAMDSIHRDVKLIVHRPEYSEESRQEYGRLGMELMPVVREIARKTLPLLEHETADDYAKNQFYGTKFQADRTAYADFRTFAKKRPPTESPSLVIGLRVDESASMSAFGRLEAAKRAVIAVYEFCHLCNIPILIYGDTADVSRQEQMSMYAYADFAKSDPSDRFRLTGIRARSNNRDGMALRIMAGRLAAAPQQTKLLISLSDGQPKAMDDYTGTNAVRDMQQTMTEFERQGVTFIAAAIGQDKDVIQHIYGSERYLDITDLTELPATLVRMIARYL